MIDVTVRVGYIHYPGQTSKSDWKRRLNNSGLRKMIMDTVFELLGFRCNYSVESIRYGSDGAVWAKVKVEAYDRLDHWESHSP